MLGKWLNHNQGISTSACWNTHPPIFQVPLLNGCHRQQRHSGVCASFSSRLPRIFPGQPPNFFGVSDYQGILICATMHMNIWFHCLRDQGSLWLEDSQEEISGGFTRGNLCHFRWDSTPQPPALDMSVKPMDHAGPKTVVSQNDFVIFIHFLNFFCCQTKVC